jgi:hypothetical protein
VGSNLNARNAQVEEEASPRGEVLDEWAQTHPTILEHLGVHIQAC